MEIDSLDVADSLDNAMSLAKEIMETKTKDWQVGFSFVEHIYNDFYRIVAIYDDEAEIDALIGVDIINM